MTLAVRFRDQFLAEWKKGSGERGMADPRLYDGEHYVVLETNQPEQLMTTAELQAKLRSVLATRQDDLPADLQRLDSLEAQVQSLLNDACELDVGPGEFLQWYVVRLEK